MALREVPIGDERSRAMMDNLTQADVDAMSGAERSLFADTGFRTGDRTSAQIRALEEKYKDRGRSGDKVLKELMDELYFDTVSVRQRDANLIKQYGKDAMKARSFESPTAPKRSTAQRYINGGTVETSGKKTSRSKPTKRFMNGGAVMSGRGVRDTKMS